MTLISNFGTFMLYMITCSIAMVAFKEHHSFNGIKHVVIPIFGLLANLVMHALLSDRALHSGGHELERTLHSARRLRGLGNLRGDLLHKEQQEAG